jgi:hypothetical protein
MSQSRSQSLTSRTGNRSVAARSRAIHRSERRDVRPLADRMTAPIGRRHRSDDSTGDSPSTAAHVSEEHRDACGTWLGNPGGRLARDRCRHRTHVPQPTSGNICPSAVVLVRAVFFWQSLLTAVPCHGLSWRTPETNHSADLRRGPPAQIPRRPGQPREFMGQVEERGEGVDVSSGVGVNAATSSISHDAWGRDAR